MSVSAAVWLLTVALIVGLALFDYLFHVRRIQKPTLRDSAVWSAIYIGAAVLFGVGVSIAAGIGPGVEYFAGYLLNQALSVDNLFIFLIVITSFAVPRVAQQKVLLFGIVFALVARSVFIFVGAALIAVFDPAFYLFGLALLIAAGNLVRPSDSDRHGADTAVVRLAKRSLRTSNTFDGDRLFTVENGKRVMTPMLLVMIVVGGTDLLFAFDSIPALFGLTSNVYIVFVSTAFSLLGLRQLYFLLGGLLDRLVYLSYGLAAVLAFIGVKLVLQALHSNNIPFLNHGKPVPVAELSTSVSLTVIVALLVLTTTVSLLSARGRTRSVAARARRHATAYLNSDHDDDPAERAELFNQLLAAERQIVTLPSKNRRWISCDAELTELVARAHRAHDAEADGRAEP